ncbi:MAG: ATP-binding protein [Gemmatimonadota bacterium]|nr:ATP-binding protein [Gemmatimonadota bacterium]
MRDLAPSTTALLFESGEYLAREVGIMAGRLAEMLAETPVSHEEPVSAGIGFLRTLASAAHGERALSEHIANGEHDRTQPIGRLAHSFSFAPVEVDLLILAGMAEEHEGLASLFRTLHPRAEPRPTVGLAAQLLVRTALERMTLRDVLTAGAAVHSGAIVLGPDAPFFERSIQLGDALWPVLAGINVWPAAIQEMRTVSSTTAYNEWLSTAPARHAVRILQSDAPALLLVVADDGVTAMHRAAALAAQAAIRVATVTFAASTPARSVEQLITLHAAARGVLPAVAVPSSTENALVDAPLFREAPGAVILCAREGSVSMNGARPVYTLYANRMSPRERAQLWNSALPELTNSATALGARYVLEPHVVQEIAEDVRARATLDERAPNTDDVAESVRARADLALAAGIRIVHPTADWNSLVLSADRTQQLRESLNRLAQQERVLDDWGFLSGRPGARGVRMLFAGPPGTGKTLAAEVLAHTVGVDLLVVDLARVVSKWIGETEKNLSDVFDAAERTHAVLLFDEADALFGKRTEVSDAHDRYANLETAYLLARLERFDGLAILSTNLRNNIDPAFTRRLEFVVDFDEPSVDERSAIWERHLPAKAPLASDVRVAELAALYPIVGGLIRNASVAAGFTAAAAETPITRTDLVRAIRREYEKSGRAFPGAPAGTLTL